MFESLIMQNALRWSLEEMAGHVFCCALIVRLMVLLEPETRILSTLSGLISLVLSL